MSYNREQAIRILRGEQAGTVRISKATTEQAMYGDGIATKLQKGVSFQDRRSSTEEKIKLNLHTVEEAEHIDKVHYVKEELKRIHTIEERDKLQTDITTDSKSLKALKDVQSTLDTAQKQNVR